ncbi:MAG TPA: FtsX-like permease family protein [Phycisphaerae bacterium]|nr:FtsX-like permease family protein [Phycisphaerae bacterium]
MQEEWLASPWLVPVVVATGVVLLGLIALVLATPVYKHIICLKYLFCGWKAVVPLVSALPAALGVFLLILVFAIMDGFVRETREMTRGTLSDIIVDAHMEGLPHYEELARRIEAVDGVEAATPVIQTYAVARIKPRLSAVKPLVRPCMVIGIRPEEKAEMGRFHEYLQRQRGSQYPLADLLKMPEAWDRDGRSPRPGCIAGVGVIGAPMRSDVQETITEGAGRRVLAVGLAIVAGVVTLFVWRAGRRRPGRTGWAVATVLCAVVLVALVAAVVFIPVRKAEVMRPQVVDFPLLAYGDDLVISTIPIRPSGAIEMQAGGIPKVASRAFTVVDRFKSGYWEADSSHVYVDFDVAQQMAGMDAQPAAGSRPAVPARTSQVQVRIADPSQAGVLVERITDVWREFARERSEVGVLQLAVNTWETQQRMILTVVEVERNITALMLGMMFIGFGVLIGLISYVMAYIKARDVGILKALGARDAGVGSLFLGYGFIIGAIGAAIGMTAALVMLANLDPIEIWVNQTLGIDVFPREMYYFDHIPKHTSPLWCIGIGAGVLALSTLASMAGGLLAALKQPVEALRYE